MGEFNLIDKPWVPCITLEGIEVEYGIRDTLLKAHELREICDDSPLVTVAILRLLLAILYRAFNGPTEMKWKNIYTKNSFDGSNEITSYLEKCYPRFFLFDETYPFMQVANLDLNEYDKDRKIKKDKSDGLMRLVREAPDKGGRVLFDHRVGTERPKYEPKQIARMLLSAQSYSGTGIASGGVIGKQTINPTPCQFAPCVEGLCLWVQGMNLFQTLMFNLVPIQFNENDLPSWEDMGLITTAINSWKTPVKFIGTIQRFTPLCRFIRILDDHSMFFTNGLKTAIDSEDSMKAYVRANDTDPFTPIKLHKDKAAWRDAHSLISIATNTKKTPASLNHIARLTLDGILSKTLQPRANVVGLATSQGKALLWRHERIPIPIKVLDSADMTERLAMLLAEAEAVGGELSRGLFWSGTTKKTIRTEPVGRIQTIVDLLLAPSFELRRNGVVRTSGGRAPGNEHNTSALNLSENLDPRPAYWARLEKHFFDLLENLPGDWDETEKYWKPDDQQTATRAWRDAIKREAERALRESVRSLGTTARAISAVARGRLDFHDDDLKAQSQKEKTKKRKLKSAGKGGKKK